MILQPSAISVGIISDRPGPLPRLGLKQAARSPYVVQERVEPVRSVFPVWNFGALEFRDMQVDVHPHAYLGKVQGCSTWLSTGKAGFSSASGIVPTFILDSK